MNKSETNYLVFDVETYLIAPGRLAPRLVCVSHIEGGEEPCLSGRGDGLALLEKSLQNPPEGFSRLIVGHNVTYDLGVIAQERWDLAPAIWEKFDRGHVWDTMIFEQLHKIARGWSKIDPVTGRVPKYSLAALCKSYFDHDLEGKTGDSWRFRYHELDGVPLSDWPEEAKKYALEDASWTEKVFRFQRDQIGDLPDFKEQVKAAWALHLMSAWGIRTDPQAVKNLAVELKETVDRSMEALKSWGILRENGTKDLGKIREIVAASYEDPPLTAKGAISTSAEVLEKSGHEGLAQLAAISSEQKLLNTYIPVLEAGTKLPINPRFNPLVDSGRTSCRGPNLQNQPRRGGVRECFVPRPGNVFVAADYHVAELCSLAQVLLDLYGHSGMAEALQAGRELHLETAAGILGIPYEEAVKGHKKGDKKVKEARQLAKAANFGFPGGLGAGSFRDYAQAGYGVKLEPHEAENLRRTWLERYPEMNQYFEDIGFRVNQSGGSFQLEQIRSGRIRGGVGFCDGCNSYFQGLTADGAKAALYEVTRECYIVKDSPLYGFRPVAFIHDEILLEGPRGLARAAAKRLETIMIEEMEKFTPDIPSKADAHLMEKWYKDAEPVYDEKGNLLIWEPVNE